MQQTTMKIVRQFLFSLFFIIICSVTVKAQGFGVRGGYNFAKVTGGDLPDKSSNNGFYLGVFYEVPILKKLLYVVPELQYSKQGFADVSLDYINVPILAKVYILKIISLELGPQFGFKVGDSGSSSENYSYSSFDPAVAAGVSVNLPFRISVNGRYISSFNEVVEGSDSKNLVFQAGLAFRF